MLQNIKVSVVVPIYNTELYLFDCLDSLRRQTHINLEIILVNDGSKDNSQAICKEFAKNDKRFNLYTIKNSGYSGARNFGIEQATGEYIAFIDSDDICHSQMIQKQLEYLGKNNAEVSVCNFYNLYPRKVAKRKCNPNIVVDSNYAMQILFGAENFKKFGIKGGYSFRYLIERKLLNNIKYPIGEICEDEYFSYNLFLHARKIVINNEYLYFYRLRSKSVSKDKSFAVKRLLGRRLILNTFGDKLCASDASILKMAILHASQELSFVEFSSIPNDIINLVNDVIADLNATRKINKTSVNIFDKIFLINWIPLKVRFLLYKLFCIKSLCARNNLIRKFFKRELFPV